MKKDEKGPPKSRKSARSLTVKKMAEGAQRRMEEEQEAKKVKEIDAYKFINTHTSFYSEETKTAASKGRRS